MKLRIICLFLLVVTINACTSVSPEANQEVKSPDNIILSELRGMNHTIRNFQDLLKRNPDEKAYGEYANFLERRMKTVNEEFSNEMDANIDAKVFFDAVESAIVSFRDASEAKRKAAQKALNEANDLASKKLNLN